MADISKIKPLGSDTTYDIKDNSAIANITRSGTTFTATRRDGTTFTFTQQDNNSDTKVNVVARGTTKAYLLADTTAPTSTAAAHTAVAETDVYLDTTAGKLVATSFAGSGIGLTDLREAYLTWGGRNFSGSYGCIDAAMVDELGANRLMFAKAAGITIEYSRDGGSTWTDYGATDIQKVGLFSTGGTFVIGKADSTNKATANGTNYQLRVTLNTGSASIYTVLNKFIIYVSTNGSNGSTVTIQRALQSSPDTYSDIATNISISGWSGYNVINVASTTTYGNTAASQYGRIRFIFRANGGSTSYNGLNVQKIMGFGGVGWTTPSTMAKTGHLYSFDASQNATFPANVTATKFIGPLQGNADSATEFSSDTTVKLTGDATGESAGSKKGWSVPVTLANSGVTAGSYGPSANAEPGYGTTFDVPYITVDAKGRVTSASTKTVKIPASDEQDHRDEGYGKITIGTASTATTGITANTNTINARTYNEKFTINPGNKWIALAATDNTTTNNSDTITIAHSVPSSITNSGPSTQQTPGFNATFNIPVVALDAAGHVTGISTTTVKIPAQTNLSGGSAATADATVVGGVTVSNHAVTVAKKTMTASTGITITGAADKVTFGVNTSDLYWANVNVSDTSSTSTEPSFNNITITDTTAKGHINFSRSGSWNYILMPNADSTYIAIGKATGGANTTMAIGLTDVIPGYQNNAIALGSSSYRWKALYIGTANSYGGTEQPIYWNAGVPAATSYALKATVNNATQWGVAYYSTARNITSTAAGTAGYPLIGQGSAAPAWYGGQVNTGTAAASWITDFKGTTASTSTTTGAVKIAGGLGVAGQVTATRVGAGGSDTSYTLYVNGTSRFAIGNSDETSNKRFIIGSSGKRYLSLGGAGVQAYASDDTVGKLYLQYNGGSFSLGEDTAITTGLFNITTATMTGAYTFNSANGFTYSGIGTASDNADRPIWFSYNGVTGRPVYDNDFKYNPSLNQIKITHGSGKSGEYRVIYPDTNSTIDMWLGVGSGNKNHGLYDDIVDKWMIVADENGNVTMNGTATQVSKNLVIKINTGSTEGTSLYTYNGSAAKTLDIKSGTGITLTAAASSLTIGHSNSVTASTAGTSSATSGVTLAVPYVTYDAQGHITTSGTHTHTVPAMTASANGVGRITAGTNIGVSYSSGNVTVTNSAVDTLTGSPAASKTITAFDQVNGAVSATFADIAISGSQVTLGTASVAVVTDANKKLSTQDLTVSSPTASGTGIDYIATISQSATGKITATKSTVRAATDSQSGVVSTAAQTFAGNKTFKGHIYTQANNTYDIGANATRFRYLYAIGGYFGGATATLGSGAGGGVYLYTNSVQYGRFYVNKTGKAPTATTSGDTTTYSGATVGEVYLELGNNKVGANNSAGVDNNAKGFLRLFSTDALATNISHGTWSGSSLTVINNGTTANTRYYSDLTLGNGTNYTSGSAHSEGRIFIYSQATHYHAIYPTSTTTNYTHYLPNANGWIATGGTATGTVAGVGSSSQPVYLSSAGVITAITGAIANNTTGSAATLTTGRKFSISDNDATNTGPASAAFNGSADLTIKLPATIKATLSGNATTATRANITTTANAVAYYTNTTGTFGSKASANGALYATAANGALQWGTLPVAQGGTGATSFTANCAIISGSSTTAALTTRAITNNTSATAVTASTNLITANTLYYHKGNSNIVTVGTISSGTWNGTTIAVGYGGTGNTSYTANRLIYSESASKLSAHANLIINTAVTYNGRTITPLLRVNGVFLANNSLESGTQVIVNRASTGGGFYLQTNGATTARLYTYRLGAASNGTTQGASGLTLFEVGNNIAQGAATSTDGANNAQGQIRIFNTTAGYSDIVGSYSALDGTNYRNHLTFGYVKGTQIWAAVWNDYAEFRATKDKIEPGRCIVEIGDDTLELSTKRLQRGCEIVSDTYGFAIGQTEECKTPIAASGRVLAYGYEPREEFAKHIGWPVCSGPDGTVSIMTEEEEEKYPSRIIGTISAVPSYEEWGEDNVKVNGRVWIRIR